MRQRGFSLLPALVVAGLLGSAGFVGLKIGPLYFDHTVVKNILENVKSDMEVEGSFNTRDVRRAIQSRMNINGLDDFIADSSFDYERNGNQILVSVNYERRTDIAYNIDAALSFSSAVAIGQP